MPAWLWHCSGSVIAGLMVLRCLCMNSSTASRALTTAVADKLAQSMIRSKCQEVEIEMHTWERPTHLTWYHSWQESHSIMEVSTL